MICLFTFVLRGPTALSPIFIFGPVAKDQTVFWVMESVRELKRGLGDSEPSWLVKFKRPLVTSHCSKYDITGDGFGFARW